MDEVLFVMNRLSLGISDKDEGSITASTHLLRSDPPDDHVARLSVVDRLTGEREGGGHIRREVLEGFHYVERVVCR